MRVEWRVSELWGKPQLTPYLLLIDMELGRCSFNVLVGPCGSYTPFMGLISYLGGVETYMGYSHLRVRKSYFMVSFAPTL